MKRTIIAICALISITGMAGCLDDGNPAATPATDNSLSIPGTPVSKASLTNALWGIGEGTDEAALCVATSNFTFDTTRTFMIMKSPVKTDYNTTPVSIVGSINAALLAETTEGRGSCPDGDLLYIISASEIAPIDIELAESMASRQNLEAKAGANPTPYPSGCAIVAHFERSGNELAFETVQESEDAEGENPEGNEDEVSEENTDETAETPPEENPDDGNASDDVPIYSLKLVVDNYDCSEEMKIPERIIIPQPPQNPPQ